MTVSTDAQLCYGIAFDEDAVFPWTDEDGDSGEDAFKEWWLTLNGFKHSFEIFDAHGEYIAGVRPSQETISRYFQEDRDFLASHPLPSIKIVKHCCDDLPMLILAVEDTLTTANRGYTEKIDVSKLIVTDDQRRGLLDFCGQYNLPGEPAWYLTSWWG